MFSHLLTALHQHSALIMVTTSDLKVYMLIFSLGINSTLFSAIIQPCPKVAFCKKVCFLIFDFTQSLSLILSPFSSGQADKKSRCSLPLDQKAFQTTATFFQRDNYIAPPTGHNKIPN